MRIFYCRVQLVDGRIIRGCMNAKNATQARILIIAAAGAMAVSSILEVTPC